MLASSLGITLIRTLSKYLDPPLFGVPFWKVLKSVSEPCVSPPHPFQESRHP